MLNKTDNSVYPCLVPDLRGNAFSWAFLIWEWCLMWGGHIWPLLYWGMFSLSAHFLESFCRKWVLNFIKSFFCIYWDGCMIFFLQWLMWCITMINLKILRNLCIPEINPTWWSCVVLKMYCWILFASILLRIFDLCHQWYWPVIFFFMVSFSSFGIRVIVASQNEFQCSFCNLLEEFQKNRC